jgi:hypothetical protein
MDRHERRWGREARKLAKNVPEPSPETKALRRAYRPEKHRTSTAKPDWVGIVEALDELGRARPAQLAEHVDDDRDAVAYALEALRRFPFVERDPERFTQGGRVEFVPFYRLATDVEGARAWAETMAEDPTEHIVWSSAPGPGRPERREYVDEATLEEIEEHIGVGLRD